ncbi:MAG: hypothetical protein JNM62_03065 [Flavobacteriales bacterium]|nr:hypothetical protein [Flavobacteriales bacterium]
MRSATPDPFKPSGDLSPATLKAYLEGRLDAAAAHEVELHMESDPLLRDAEAGLRLPGACAGAGALNAHRPTGAGSSWAVWALSAIVVSTAGTLWYASIDPAGTAAKDPVHAQGTEVPSLTRGAAAVRIQQQEIQAAIEIPESLHIGHSIGERHALSALSVQASAPTDTAARITVDPVQPRTTAPPLAGDAIEGMALRRHQRPSMQLVYLHDLKLIHPKEVYGRSPEVDATATGVDARFSNAAERDQASMQERRVAYLTFMDEALEKFVQNDHKGCLEDLRFVLAQYPDDVNALFYAGLCCYNLGMNERAERFLERAAHHSFPVFDEEAEWYHALALQRLGEQGPAQEAFHRIVRAQGFYAGRAAERIARH